MKSLLALACLFMSAFPAWAGLYYSAEQEAELPAQWRGFLLDQRALRMIGMAPANFPPTLLRQQYQEAAAKLAKVTQQRPLSADEAADLGALYVRLGEPAKAIEVLRAAQRQNPEHFRVAANLGTAWQMQGDLNEATRALRESVRLAPARTKIFEEYQLKLAQARAKEGKNPAAFDDLFGASYLGESGKLEAGRIAAADKKKLPEADAAIVQQLALWLPADGRLLWQLGEIANAHGDVRTAANLLDGCVTEFALASPDLRRRRQFYREAADQIAKLPDSEHNKYRGDLKMRSTRPLAAKLDASMLPAIRPNGVNALPWLVLGETSIGRGFRPNFNKYLSDLDGKRVAMTGYMYPVTMEMTDLNVFMFVEYPIGCWFCETPDPTGIVFVSLADGKTSPLKRGLVKVEGVLKLNRSDPEQYLHALNEASIGEPD
jgi:Tfp pilus assembly protein PilF